MIDGMVIAKRILAAVCALALAALAVLCVVRLVGEFQYDAAHPTPEPIEPALAKSCLAGNDSACLELPAAREKDAESQGGTASVLPVLGAAFSGCGGLACGAYALKGRRAFAGWSW